MENVDSNTNVKMNIEKLPPIIQINNQQQQSVFTHYVITRFSVRFDYMKTNNPFELNRLNARFNLFQKICYPSVINQTNTNFIWVILIDKHLPNNYKDLLYSILSTNKKIKIKVVEWNVNNQLGNAKWLHPNTTEIITTRLDDDDAMHPNMISDIQNYYNNPKGRNGKVCFITFPYGIRIEPYKKQLEIQNNPFIAIGLSMITDVTKFPFNIYKFNHRKIIRNGRIDFPYIVAITRERISNIGYMVLRPKIAMWLWTVHQNNDSGGRFIINKNNSNSKNRKLNMELNMNKGVVFRKFNVLL